MVYHQYFSGKVSHSGAAARSSDHALDVRDNYLPLLIHVDQAYRVVSEKYLYELKIKT